MRADGEAGGAQRLDEVLKLVRTKVASAQRATVEDTVRGLDEQTWQQRRQRWEKLTRKDE